MKRVTPVFCFIMAKKTNKKRIKPLKIPASGEHVLFTVLLTIALLLGGLLYGASEQIKREMVSVAPARPISKTERQVRKLVTNHPIAEMVPFIAAQDKEVAAFIVAIAKKESNWGKFSPKKEGKECYNYWGYRGTYNQTASGYSCFDSPRQAVSVVGKRIAALIDQDINTPQEMVVWKCGWNCRDSAAAVGAGKWIQDVDLYYDKVYN